MKQLIDDLTNDFECTESELISALLKFADKGEIKPSLLNLEIESQKGNKDWYLMTQKDMVHCFMCLQYFVDLCDYGFEETTENINTHKENALELLNPIRKFLQ